VLLELVTSQPPQRPKNYRSSLGLHCYTKAKMFSINGMEIACHKVFRECRVIFPCIHDIITYSGEFFPVAFLIDYASLQEPACETPLQVSRNNPFRILSSYPGTRSLRNPFQVSGNPLLGTFSASQHGVQSSHIQNF
jgi:hypothetical protein